MQITISQKDFKDEDLKTTVSDCWLDVLAQAAGHGTQEDNWEYEADYTDNAKSYVLNNYDYETEFLDELNQNKTELVDGMDPTSDHYHIWMNTKTNLLFGAWFALNDPECFESELKTFEETIKEDPESCEITPADLLKEVEKAETEASNEFFHEWLYGDRSNNGVLQDLSKIFTGSYRDVNYDKEAQTITIEIGDDELDEFVGAWQYDDPKEVAELKKPENVKASILEFIINKATNNYEKEQTQKNKRREEYAKTKKYQEERAATEKAEKIAKLNSMTKK
jgi:hypothetical protein